MNFLPIATFSSTLKSPNQVEPSNVSHRYVSPALKGFLFFVTQEENKSDLWDHDHGR